MIVCPGPKDSGRLLEATMSAALLGAPGVNSRARVRQTVARRGFHARVSRYGVNPWYCTVSPFLARAQHVTHEAVTCEDAATVVRHYSAVPVADNVRPFLTTSEAQRATASYIRPHDIETLLSGFLSSVFLAMSVVGFSLVRRRHLPRLVALKSNTCQAGLPGFLPPGL